MEYPLQGHLRTGPLPCEVNLFFLVEVLGAQVLGSTSELHQLLPLSGASTPTLRYAESLELVLVAMVRKSPAFTSSSLPKQEWGFDCLTPLWLMRAKALSLLELLLRKRPLSLYSAWVLACAFQREKVAGGKNWCLERTGHEETRRGLSLQWLSIRLSFLLLHQLPEMS